MSAAPTPRIDPPKGLHHVAYMTRDSAKTVDFYTRIMGMKFVATVANNEVPSTGDPFPYLHLFFQLGDGSLIAFFESIGLPPPSPSAHRAYDVFNHLALEVGSREEVDRWIEHLQASGIDVVGPVEHAVIYSAYCHDPNGIRLEFTTTLDPSFVEQEKLAWEDLASWEAEKKRVEESGGDTSSLRAWVNERNGRHKLGSPPEA
jgi:catechol 2,3-dioxygenase-like lactoylglutathione lyase family enzyme